MATDQRAARLTLNEYITRPHCE